MKKVCFLIIFFISACSSSEIKTDLDNDLNFSKNMNFEQFRLKVINYANQSSYPNIDN